MGTAKIRHHSTERLWRPVTCGGVDKGARNSCQHHIKLRELRPGREESKIFCPSPACVRVHRAAPRDVLAGDALSHTADFAFPITATNSASVEAISPPLSTTKVSTCRLTPTPSSPVWRRSERSPKQRLPSPAAYPSSTTVPESGSWPSRSATRSELERMARVLRRPISSIMSCSLPAARAASISAWAVKVQGSTGSTTASRAGR